jgi:hypothetical protein
VLSKLTVNVGLRCEDEVDVAEAECMMETYARCNVMNLIISVRDLNLVRIRTSIDEYNDLLEEIDDFNYFNALDLMNTELVSNITIILGSLFINPNEEISCNNYMEYMAATKDDVLILINDHRFNIVGLLVDCLSGGCKKQKMGKKSYDILKQAIIAKLGGVRSTRNECPVSSIELLNALLLR